MSLPTKAQRHSGELGHGRLTVRTFPDADRLGRFLCGRSGIEWREYDGPLTGGTYAFVGGEWRNVRKIDPDLLAHV
jgi:hypothetical protein